VSTTDPYAPASVWDNKHGAGEELNPQGWWMPTWLPVLVAARAQTVLDVGCGNGADAVSLAGEGFSVAALDYSAVALARARARAAANGVVVDFRQADMAVPLPYGDGHFDAVMSNVAMHMFDDRTTRHIVTEMGRVLRPGGLLLLHVNSIEDMAYRTEHFGRARVQTLEADFYREMDGQTMHFFSEDYCRDILAGWLRVELTPVRLRDAADAVIKCVWRCVAQKPE
jgi:SAM-dependent methyltransferase